MVLGELSGIFTERINAFMLPERNSGKVRYSPLNGVVALLEIASHPALNTVDQLKDAKFFQIKPAPIP